MDASAESSSPLATPKQRILAALDHVEAMDAFEMKRRYGDRVTFNGGIGTQRVLPYGTPQQVRDEARRCLDELGRGGGYIAAPTKPIPAETPVENAVALIETLTQQ